MEKKTFFIAEERKTNQRTMESDAACNRAEVRMHHYFG
jgi:hypothetical protein